MAPAAATRTLPSPPPAATATRANPSPPPAAATRTIPSSARTYALVEVSLDSNACECSVYQNALQSIPDVGEARLQWYKWVFRVNKDHHLFFWHVRNISL